MSATDRPDPRLAPRARRPRRPPGGPRRAGVPTGVPTGLLAPLALLLAAAAAPAAAQPGSAYPAYSRFEVTPFVGYRLDGEVDDLRIVDAEGQLEADEGGIFGVLVDLAVTPSFAIELRADRQETELGRGGGSFREPDVVADLTLTTAHVGIVFQGGSGQVRPFFAVAGGVTRVEPDLPTAESETRLSGALGGGVKLLLSPRFGLRLEARALATDLGDTFDDDDRRFRDDDDAVLVQPEATVGLIFSF